MTSGSDSPPPPVDLEAVKKLCDARLDDPYGFTEAAPALVPQLVAEVERLREDLDTARIAGDRWFGAWKSLGDDFAAKLAEVERERDALKADREHALTELGRAGASDKAKAAVFRAMVDEGWTFEDVDEDDNDRALDHIVSVAWEPALAAVLHIRAARDSAITALATVTAERDAIRDCGQDGVCALAPGCMRHFAERGRELVTERDAMRAVVEAARKFKFAELHGTGEASWTAERDMFAALTALDAGKEGGNG